MPVIKIQKSDIESYEMTAFRFGVLEGNHAHWKIDRDAIITKNIAALIKQSFREMMPYIRKRYSDIPNPFYGVVDIQARRGTVVEVKFTTHN